MQFDKSVVALVWEHSTLTVELAQENQTTWVRFFEARHTRI